MKFKKVSTTNLIERLIARGESSTNKSNRFNNSEAGKFFFDVEDIYGENCPYGKVAFYNLSDTAKLYKGENSLTYVLEHQNYKLSQKNIQQINLILSNHGVSTIAQSTTIMELLDYLEQLDSLDADEDEDISPSITSLDVIQYIAKELLILQGYDGAEWEMECYNDPARQYGWDFDKQYQIWNGQIVKQVPLTPDLIAKYFSHKS